MLFELSFNYLAQLYLLYDHDLETHHLNKNNMRASASSLWYKMCT